MSVTVPMPTLHSEPCDCPPGRCLHFCDPDTSCINRIAGAVTAKCDRCEGNTWHSPDGTCLRCAQR